MSTTGDPLHRELSRIADGVGPVAEHARTALGDGPLPDKLCAAIRALAEHRGPASSTCPSDAARAVGGEGWRDLMTQTRDIARSLAKAGHVDVTQRGAVLDPDGQWRGPVRIRFRPSPP